MECAKVYLLILMVVTTQCGELKRPTREIGVISSIKNKIHSVQEYIKEKEQNFYHRVGKISSLFRSSETNQNENMLTRMKKRLTDYINKSDKGDGILYDAIAPEDGKNKCTDDQIIDHLTTTQLTALYGYVSESHTIITEDGYFLTLHRIPYSKKSTTKSASNKTVLLYHGLLGSSADWVILGPNKALAFRLSDAGYDVWMANIRGNMYSRDHVSRKIDTYAFWNFTFDDVSQYDLPATIDYIMNVKGNRIELNYIGYSMGTTVLFAMLSTKTQYNRILRAGFAMAPVSYMTDVDSPVRLLAQYSNDLAYIFKLLGANEFLPRNAVLRYLSKHSCKISNFEEALCEMSMFVFCSSSRSRFDRSLIPIIFGHIPAGASTKTLVHYAQEINKNGTFQKFDYGKKGNLIQYGTEEAPEYEVEKITLPIALMSAESDALSSISSSEILYARLPNPIEHYIVPLKEFSHLDFLFATDAPSLVYDKLLRLLEQPIPSVSYVQNN